MKRILTLMFVLLTAVMMQAQGNAVTLEITSGISQPALKAKMERNASALLSLLNRCYKSNAERLDVASLGLDERAGSGLAMLWENAHFYVDDETVVTNVLRSGPGQWQVRGIPLMVTPQHETLDDEYQEGIIVFDATGRITRFNFSIAVNIYTNVMSKGKTVEDVERRHQILSYVEQFRTAYCEKDIQFLEDVFSEDALIITGTVVKRKTPSDGSTVALSGGDVKYTKQTKTQYISNLKRSFAANSWINVQFDDVKIVKHPKASMEGFYGVTVRQKYSNSRGYSDDGYLFMLWDFRNPDNVQIHVRTWQPYWLDDKHTQSLPKEDVFRPSDFELQL